MKRQGTHTHTPRDNVTPVSKYEEEEEGLEQRRNVPATLELVSTVSVVDVRVPATKVSDVTAEAGAAAAQLAEIT